MLVFCCYMNAVYLFLLIFLYFRLFFEEGFEKFVVFVVVQLPKL